MTIIDINFDVYSDTPKGRDPDSYSPTLRSYHKILWSKDLPNGVRFDLDDNTPRLLHHKSELGEFLLSSDSIGHTYSRVKSMSHIINQIPSEEINSFFSTCSTIGAYIIFPSKKDPQKPMDFRAPFEKALEEGQISNFKFHDLRHSCASFLAMGGVPIRTIAEILGHSNTSVTVRYSHLNQEHLKKSLDELSKILSN